MAQVSEVPVAFVGADLRVLVMVVSVDFTVMTRTISLIKLAKNLKLFKINLNSAI